MALDLRTDAEKAKAERDAKIVADYLAIRAESPEYSKHRVHCFLAERYGMTYPTISKIVTAAGVNV